MVQELVILVGRVKQGRTGGLGSEIIVSKAGAYNFSALPVKKAASRQLTDLKVQEMKPEKVIPLEDDDFKDF